MRSAPLALLAVVLAALVITTTHAYSTTASVYTPSAGVMAYELNVNNPSDVCTMAISGSHIAMGTSASIQARIQETANSGGVTTNVPLGGGTLQATCLSTLCDWRWTRGLFYYSWPVFYRGAYYTGPDSSNVATPTGKTEAVANAYTNWDTNFPISWSNLSYWGKRLVVLQPSNGKWRNVEVSTRFTHLVCEHYVYTNSDGATGIIPTFPGGSGIPIVSSSGHVYSYCGHDIKKDSQGRWLLPRCNNPFPWWAGLIIAVVCYVILVAVIIIVWCCCCAARRNREEKHRRSVIATEEDNTGRIPNQSELGLSRNASFAQHDDNSSTFSDAEGSDSEESNLHRE